MVLSGRFCRSGHFFFKNLLTGLKKVLYSFQKTLLLKLLNALLMN